jgi:hypothetical protein
VQKCVCVCVCVYVVSSKLLAGVREKGNLHVESCWEALFATPHRRKSGPAIRSRVDFLSRHLQVCSDSDGAFNRSSVQVVMTRTSEWLWRQ